MVENLFAHGNQCALSNGSLATIYVLVKYGEVRQNNFYLVRTTRISEESMDPPWSLSNTLKIQPSLSSGFVTLYPDKYQTMSFSYDVFAVDLFAETAVIYSTKSTYPLPFESTMSKIA